MYVRFLIRGLKKNNINFSILTSKKIKQHPVFKILKKEKSNINFFFLEDLNYPRKKNFISLFVFQISNYLKIKKGYDQTIKKKKFDHIFLTTIDHIDKVIPFFGSPFGKKNFSSIILNPKNHLYEYKLANYNIKKFIYDFTIKKILKLNTLKFLYSNDPLFTKYVKKKYLKFKHKIFYFSEPVEIHSSKNKTIIKKKLKFKNSDFIILVYGAIKNSKSVTDLVTILNNKTLRKNIKVLLCGQQTIEIKNLLKNKVCLNLKKQKKIIVINKFLNLKEESEVFSASDLIWIVYKNSSMGSSGILFLAKKAKTPIITTKFGLPYWFNRKYNLGPSIDLKERKNTIKILNNLSSKKKFYNTYKKNISKLGKKNYVKEFYLMILKNLELDK